MHVRRSLIIVALGGLQVTLFGVELQRPHL